jgi:hypothetical protein
MMTTSITAPRVDNLFLLRDIHFLLLGGVAKRHLPIKWTSPELSGIIREKSPLGDARGFQGTLGGTISPRRFRPPRMPVKSILRECPKSFIPSDLHKLPGEKYAHLE